MEGLPQMTRTAAAAALFAFAIAACDQTEPRVPYAMVVSPDSAAAGTVGETVPFRAQVRDVDGDVIHEADIRWSSSDERVATVSGRGVATVTGHGTAEIRATHGSVSGSARLVVVLTPASVVKVVGDLQTAPGLSALPVNPGVRVEDASGAPIPGVRVSFGVALGFGGVDPASAVSDGLGVARTRWTLGQREGEQRMRAWIGSIWAEFTATATEPELTITTSELERARATVAYRDTLAFVGLHTPPLRWSVTEGTLPAGMLLDSTGVLLGTPAAPGSADFTVTVSDAAGRENSRPLSLRVCDPPLQMATGEVLVLEEFDFSGCPPLLPAGAAGDRYRVAAVHAGVGGSGALPTLTVSVRAIGAGSDPPMQLPDAWADPAGRVPVTAGPTDPAQALRRLPPGLAAGVRIAEATERHHTALFTEAERLIRRLGKDAILPDTRVAAGASGAAYHGTPPDDRILLIPYRAAANCAPPAQDPVPALLVGYSDHLAIYQDSVQRAGTPVSAEHARAVLDYYAAYGVETIAEFFGEVPDINGDGRVTVFVSPVVPEEVAAFVWPGDFLAKSSCAVSNEMELVYINADLFSALGAPAETRHYHALSTVVHEVKHVVSLYRRSAAGRHHPLWVEEGTAEIGTEISSRKAMEANGGVARTAVLRRDAYPPRDGSIITPENYGMLVTLARTMVSYTAPINSIAGNYSEGHTFYGTSWHFHRFLGDAYGGAAQGMDGELFLALNDTVLPSGTPGIEEATGASMAVLMQQYATAMMLNGTDGTRPERAFRTYDFPSATFQLFRPQSQPDGLYPWPVTGPAPAPFRTDAFIGFLAPGGIRFHDFESDGGGVGIELAVSAGVLPGLRVVIVRLR